MSDFAAELLKGERSGKYSPIEVAQWLEDLAETATRNLAEAEKQTAGKLSPDFRRVAADVKLQIGIGQFFAAKFRSGTLYAIHDQSGDRAALEEAVETYRRAREIWAAFAEAAKGVYASDISFGPRPDQRGHWLDRLPAIDADIAAMAKRLDSTAQATEQSARVQAATQQALGRPQRNSVACDHTPPPHFVPGEPLPLVLSVAPSALPISARLYYRHVNQAEHYQMAEATAQGREHHAQIPASYSKSLYPLQYYFELKEESLNQGSLKDESLKEGSQTAWLYPGFAPDLANQPYFVVRRAAPTA
jgi:hypothetical protein